MAVLTPDAAQRQIAAGTIDPVYLLVGDDARVLTTVSNALDGTIEDELRAFNSERLYATDKGTQPSAAVEAARVAPMMSPRRLVVVLRSEAWLKPKPKRPSMVETQEDAEAQDESGDRTAVDKSALGPLVEYLKSPVPTTTLVLVAADVNKSLGAVKALYKSATVVECWGLPDREGARAGDPIRQALTIIKQTAAAGGRTIDSAAAQALADRSDGDIGKLRADLDHVLLFAQTGRAITRADVDAVVGDRGTVQDPWAIVNAVEQGNAAEALRHLGAALEDGAVPVMVLGQLAWFVRDKLPRVRPRQTPAAVQAVFRTDLDLKSSGGDPRVLLERLVLELCGEPRRRKA